MRSSFSLNPVDWFGGGRRGGGGGGDPVEGPPASPIAGPTGGGSGDMGNVSVPGSVGADPQFSWWSLLPAVISAGADIYSANKMARGQESANQASLQSAREQMAFQERMSNTAHQREVRDLAAAGINPVLSANAGASTPAGSSVTFGNAAPDYRGILSKGIDSAFRFRQMSKDIESANASIAVAKANELLTKNQAEAARNSAKVNEAEARIRAAEAVAAEQEAEFYRENPNYIQIKKGVDLVAPVVGTARDVAVTYRAAKGLDGKGESRYERSRGDFLRSKGAIPKSWKVGREE